MLPPFSSRKLGAVRRDVARYNETASSGFVRVSTLAFRTFQAYFARPRPKEEICLRQKSFFFPPFPNDVHPRARPRPPHNMWHVRGLVISSELDSSSIQLRVHDPVERILCAPALCGISGPYSRVIDFCFC